MHISATIQARMGSSRLPGKVLADICGKPMLLWQIERIQRSRLVDEVIVATTTNCFDDQIEEFCKKQRIDCYRGSENDVLGRISSLIQERAIEIHLEFCGDTPLTDPQIIDEFIGYYLKHQKNIDGLTSARNPSYPPGFEITIYSGKSLLKVNQMVSASDPMREHVWFNLLRFPGIFNLKQLEAPEWFKYPETYIEVDTLEDLEVVKSIVKNFEKRRKKHFGLEKILEFLFDNEDIRQSNHHIKRKWEKLLK